MIHAVYLIPFVPLVGFAILVPFGRKIGNPGAGIVATTAVGGAFVCTLITFIALFNRAPAQRSFDQHLFTWFSVDQLHVNVGFLVDPLSLTMAMFVTGVSTLIHLYSIAYMKEDRGFPRFFVYLNLFVFAMLMLVLADNFLVSFLGWEGVGVCSYFLIAFWFDRPSAASAGKKAMIYNRIGDAAFLIALFLIFERTGSLQYQTVFANLGHVGEPSLIAIGLLLFAGAAGKSAQIPLFPWLVDAMEGPTPVSALIHAATMVTAGVYLMCRINPILHLAPDAAHAIAWIGASTALVAATAGCAQTDIKKVLAYSTVSQLGYMFLAAGSGAYVAAIFLMLTHAFYKALLFLGAGSVIHGMDEEQNIKKMGALRKLMPLTAITFMIGWLSIAGFPLLSGFWAKGEVLVNAWGISPGLWAIGAVTAILTAYYMGREYLLVFGGAKRWAETQDGHGHGLHPHDPSWMMTLPLVALSVCAALGGFIDLPFHPDFDFLERWLQPVVGASLYTHQWSVGELWAFAIGDGALAITGIAIAVLVWRTAVDRPALEPKVLFKAWYIDATYDRLVARTSETFANFTTAVVEAKVIDGAVNGVATLVRGTGSKLRRVQSGYVRNYALGIVIGAVLIVAFILIRVGS